MQIDKNIPNYLTILRIVAIPLIVMSFYFGDSKFAHRIGGIVFAILILFMVFFYSLWLCVLKARQDTIKKFRGIEDYANTSIRKSGRPSEKTNDFIMLKFEKLNAKITISSYHVYRKIKRRG